jgi:hypothetical protein
MEDPPAETLNQLNTALGPTEFAPVEGADALRVAVFPEHMVTPLTVGAAGALTLTTAFAEFVHPLRSGRSRCDSIGGSRSRSGGSSCRSPCVGNYRISYIEFNAPVQQSSAAGSTSIIRNP